MIKQNKIARLVLVLLSVFVLISLVRYTVLNNLISGKQSVSNSIVRESTDDYLELYLNSTINDYISKSDIMTNEMKNEILINLSKEQISEDLSGEYSSQFYEYVVKNLYTNNEIIRKDKPKAITYLATKDGILAMYSNNIKTLKFQNKNKFITWADFYKSVNLPEDKESITNRFIDNEKDYVIINKYEKDHKTYTVEEIIKIYNEKGLDALNDYKLVVCSKITDTGDILGNPDSQFMKRSGNHKMYVMSSISLYDIMKNEENSIKKTKEKWEEQVNTNVISNFIIDDMLINVTYGMIIFTLVVILYTNKFEK